MDSISVIVTSWNALPYSKICYKAYKRYTSNPNAELVWIDNGSEDGTQEWLSSVDIDHLILLRRNLGACNARNVAAQETQSETICFLDNDIRVTQVGWTKRLLRVLKSREQIGAVAPACNLVHDDTRLRSFTEPIDSAYARILQYDRKDGSVFHHADDVSPYIKYYLARLRSKPFRGDLVLEGGGTTMRRDTFLDIKYPQDYRISHTGTYLMKGLHDKELETWVVPSVFLFHYGHATRNREMIPDIDDKIRRSTIERDKWLGRL